MPNINLPTIEMDGCNQTVIIAANVEYDKITDFISGWEGIAQFIETAEFGITDNFIPSGKRALTIGMLFPKLA